MTAIRQERQPACSWEEARAFIAATYKPVADTESCAPATSLGRIVAQDVRAPLALPRLDTAAMDGFAIAEPGRAGQSFHIVGTLRAGKRWVFTLQPGEALRILTGAPVPPGTRRVLRDEDCTIAAGRMTLIAAPAGHDHIRRSGADLATGERILAAGQRMTPGALGLLSALGIRAVPLRRRLEVFLISTGDELTMDGNCAPGQIRDANGPMLRAGLELLGCHVTGPVLLRDDPQTLRETLIRAARDSDLIVTSGGASSSESDHFARLIPERGFLELWRLAIRPGRTLALGDIDDCPILSLPGNPVAALVAFLLIGQPLIARLAGAADDGPPVLTMPLAAAAKGTAGILTALPARRADTPQGLVAAPVDLHHAGRLMALADAEGWILVPGETPDLAAGALVRFLPNPRLAGQSDPTGLSSRPRPGRLAGMPHGVT